MTHVRRIGLAAALATTTILGAGGASAIVMTGEQTAEALAEELFSGIEGVTVTGSSISGAPPQFGTFTNERGTYGLPSSGIALSTGNVSDYGTGLNRVSGNTTDFESSATEAQEALLDPITAVPDFLGPPGDLPGDDVPFDFPEASTSADAPELITLDHFDVAQLSITFDVDEGVDTITFFGVFGSEEFPSFSNSEFNDGFGLFVNGTNVAFSDGLPINVNHPDFLGAFNEDLLIIGDGPIDLDGPFLEGDGPPLLAVSSEIDGLDLPDTPLDNTVLEPGDPRLANVTGTELAGVIAPLADPILRFDVPVNGNESNTIELIIGDASDGILDSTVYLSSLEPQEVPLNDGVTEFTPILPNDPDPLNGIFSFLFEEGVIDEGQIFFIDPPVAVGYTYTVENAEFASVLAPALGAVPDLDGYTITVGTTSFDILPGEQLFFSDFGLSNVTEFELSGIDPLLLLDPDDPLAFPLGLTLQNISGPVSIDQDPTIVDVAVPLPAGLPLYLGALATLFMVRRWRRA